MYVISLMASIGLASVYMYLDPTRVNRVTISCLLKTFFCKISVDALTSYNTLQCLQAQPLAAGRAISLEG